ncbi:hypothetical protein [Azospirillum palustre]|uniref:hypothetical protein n=1 Tax=Azospirillum palustre TaxID=2044885 RepID=UPI00137AC5EE|nr:hypothetical protein [Azospirillum palustre]
MDRTTISAGDKVAVYGRKDGEIAFQNRAVVAHVTPNRIILTNGAAYSVET